MHTKTVGVQKELYGFSLPSGFSPHPTSLLCTCSFAFPLLSPPLSAFLYLHFCITKSCISFSCYLPTVCTSALIAGDTFLRLSSLCISRDSIRRGWQAVSFWKALYCVTHPHIKRLANSSGAPCKKARRSYRGSANQPKSDLKLSNGFRIVLFWADLSN